MPRAPRSAKLLLGGAGAAALLRLARRRRATAPQEQEVDRLRAELRDELERVADKRPDAPR
jgi:hypothetical protein